MAGLKGIARVKDLDPRARRNFNRLAQRFDDLLLAAPLALDAEGKFSINLGDGVTLSGTLLAVDPGNGVELSGGKVVVTAGANVSVDSAGVNALPIPEWFLSGGANVARQDAIAAAGEAAASADSDVEARARSFAWFV